MPCNNLVVDRFVKQRTPSVGLLGVTGRLGTQVARALELSPSFSLGFSMGRLVDPQTAWAQVFAENDLVVDCSVGEVTEQILSVACAHPKPLLLCATGAPPTEQHHFLLDQLSQHVPVVSAPNTSRGAYLQERLMAWLAKQYPPEQCDVHLHEVHHRNKRDAPSGTAQRLIAAASDHKVACTSMRSGQLLGEHTVTLTTDHEQFTLQHRILDRQICADGVVQLLSWLCQAVPGVYTVSDVWHTEGPS